MGLHLSLEGVGAVLGLEKQKLTEGKSLIKYFCVPCAPTKVNGGRTRNLPEHDMEKWQRFKAYNLRDVETEMGIQAKLSRFPVSDKIWNEYRVSEEINDCGIGVDMVFVKEAIEIDSKSREHLTAIIQTMINIDNQNSVQQMKSCLADNGIEMDSLGKKEVAAAIKMASQGYYRRAVPTSAACQEQCEKIHSYGKCRVQGQPCERYVSILRCQPYRTICRKADSASESPTESYGRSGRGTCFCA